MFGLVRVAAVRSLATATAARPTGAAARGRGGLVLDGASSFAAKQVARSVLASTRKHSSASSVREGGVE